MTREQERVLPFPAEARQDGQVALEQGAGIHVASALDAGVDLPQVAQDADEPLLHELVVVPAVGVARDFSVSLRVGRLAFGFVLHGDDQDSAGLRPEAAQIPAHVGVSGEIAHLARVAAFDPFEVASVRLAQAGRGDGGQIEAV